MSNFFNYSTFKGQNPVRLVQGEISTKYEVRSALRAYPQIAQITQRLGLVLPVLAQPGVPNATEANPSWAGSAWSC
jgi:hypothetical protein